MKKLFLALSLVSLFSLNVEAQEKYPQKHQSEQQYEKNSVSQKDKNEDNYWNDFKGMQLTNSQKNKISELHQRRISKFPKMKSQKKGLSETQYKQQVRKVLNSNQRVQFDKIHH
ncbi:hypothetical protein [Cloacibacterium sp.]|uniref:hypothetical protein n=1 Tax=Cloacibacterium sp. TaxID=1913682 RepID=UPI0039E5D5E7